MKSTITFEEYGSKGQTRVRVRHRNGNIIFHAGQGYSRKIDAESMLANFINSVRNEDYDYLDKAHGRTTTKVPDDVEITDEEPTDAAQGGAS